MRRNRAIHLVLAVIAGMLVMTLLLSVSGRQARAVTPTPTPPGDPFSATLSLATSNAALAVGEELLATVTLDVVTGCQYPVLELDLRQEGAGGAVLLPIDPLQALVHVPGAWPFTYRLRAISPGTVTLRATTFGERNCNDFWNWAWLSTEPVTIRVNGPAGRAYLPMLWR